MPLNQRRLLFFFFVLLFIAIVPIMYLYATGQTVNWQRRELEKTSSLVIESLPTHAQVILDREPIGRRLSSAILGGTVNATKAKITNLRPGAYEVELRKDGYWPWRSHLTLYPGEARSVGPIRLFKHSEPALIASAETSALFIPAPEARRLALVDGLRVTVIPTDRPEATAVFSLDAPVATVSWSARGDTLIAGTAIIDTITGSVSSLPAAQPIRLDWDSADNEILYFIDQNRLYRHNTATGLAEIIFGHADELAGRTLVDYAVTPDRLYVIASNGETNASLIIRHRSSERRAELPLPSGRFTFYDTVGNASVINIATGSVYFVEEPLPLLFRFLLTSGPERVAVGDWRNGRLTYATPLEVRRWHNGQEALIARLSQPVLAVTGLPDPDYLIVGTANSILLQPERNDPLLNGLTLAEVDNLSGLAAAPDGTVYFHGTYGGATGLFKLEIL